jgi:hypothetical protein
MMLGRSRNNKSPGNVASSNETNGWKYPTVAVTVSLRRGRLYFVGKFDDFTVNVTPDFGGSPDGSPTLYEANINYTGIKPVEPVGRLAPL